MADSALGTAEQLRDPHYTPPLAHAVPLGIQHVLAMFVSNVTPAIIVAGAAGFGFGSNSPDFPNMIYMIQMSMLFAGIATLIQTIGIGPVGAKLPVVQGTSFAFLPVMIPAYIDLALPCWGCWSRLQRTCGVPGVLLLSKSPGRDSRLRHQIDNCERIICACQQVESQKVIESQPGKFPCVPHCLGR